MIRFEKDIFYYSDELLQTSDGFLYTSKRLRRKAVWEDIQVDFFMIAHWS
jgi:hypothetical protein